MRFVPGLQAAREYRREWLRDDLVAGIVLTALLVPQGMAYAGLAGLPPIAGVYATLVPLIAYAVFGPSRILIIAPDSAIAPLIAAAIIPLAAAGDERMGMAALLALMVGGLCLIGGIARLGFVTDLLSKPVRVGYLAGIAIVVLADQAAKVLGIEIEAEDFLSGLVELVTSLDETVTLTAAIGLGTFVALLAIKWRFPRAPGALLAVIAGIALVVVLDLQSVIPVVGEVPPGLPSFTVPPLDAGLIRDLAVPALAVAFVAFADTSVLSRSFASRRGERVDQDQELFALGASNLAVGFFQGYPVSSSSTRTPAAEAAGAKSQLTGIVAAVLLGIILLFATGLLAPLPEATLAAIVMIAVVGLIDIPDMRRLFRMNRADFALSMAALLGVAIVGVIPGIGVAIGLSVGALLWRAWHPYTAVLGRIDGRKGYHDRDRHPEGRQVPGLVLYRFDAPLFFANADAFRDGVLDAIAQAEAPVRRVVVAAEPITDVDTTAADMLIELLDQLDQRDIGLSFAELKGPVKDTVERYDLDTRLAAPPFPSTVGEAVHAYLAEFDVPWEDWEDAEEHEAGQGQAR
ncbi:MAG TPA: SulP family inorganic anion transporter [Candidatus Limnocylindria bacterium]|nr:SulP family inorganic anion transporter [Candidatus Limnocylindria bacterium]